MTERTIKSAELRERYLKFFEAHDHTRVASDSLIPSGDPTVLFTSAGMNQFKDYFLGKRTDVKRATSCQKCLRTGDLDRVGKTPSHHSFFEMLGNFSFGDYFKAEAIQWAWEFLTGTTNFGGTHRSPHERFCLSLPASKLWISIYEDDEEAFTLWRALGVPENRIKRFGQADNFWPANAPKDGPNGPCGPCGPCSEIYYDPDGAVHSAKSVEIWNLVFTQFDRQPDGSLKSLPKPNIDTGMGLERLSQVMLHEQLLARAPTGTQFDVTDYATDLFNGIIKHTARSVSISPDTKNPDELWSLFTISDHIRAVAFLIAEQLLPSNLGRGYVLRMLIRRAHWHGGRLLWNRGQRPPFQPFLVEALPALIEVMGTAYPELVKNEGLIRKVVREEEGRFSEILQIGNERIQEECERLRSHGEGVLSGEFAFLLKDTFGFPYELLKDIVKQYYPELLINEERYKALLVEQQERSRAGSRFSGGVFVPPKIPPLMKFHAEELFVGYDLEELDTKIKGIWNQSEWVLKAIEGEEIGLVLEQSPFYGESGGQVGDCGTIECPHGILEVIDTQWVDELLVHYAKVRHGSIEKDQPVRAKVNKERRLKVARSHTATHLLHWALRKVLGLDAVQAGSYVDVERVRFDFSSLQPLHEEQRYEVEELVNRRVRLVDEVHTAKMRLEEAKRNGALALFGEKYGGVVRVVNIGDYSKELCGGTHVPHTGFVGTFMIVAESSIAAGTRRIEALVGDAAAAQQHQQQRLLHEAAKRLGRPAQDVVVGLEDLLEQLKRTERDRKALQLALAKVEASRLVAEGKRINGVTLVTSTIKQADREVLAVLADAIKTSLQRAGVVLLASSEGPAHVSLVMATTSDLTTRVHAGQLLKAVAPLAKGSGGGRPEFAQAGGKDPSGIPAALKRAEELVREALERS